MPKVWKRWGPNWEISWLCYYSRIMGPKILLIWHGLYLHVWSPAYDNCMAFAPSYSLANKLCPSFVKNCMIQRVPFLRQLSIVDLHWVALTLTLLSKIKAQGAGWGFPTPREHPISTDHVHSELVWTWFWPLLKKAQDAWGGFSHVTWNTPASRTVVHLEVAACDFEPLVKRTFRCREKVTSREHHEIYSQPTSEVLLALWINVKLWPTIYAWRPFYLPHVDVLRSTRCLHLEVGGLWLWSLLYKPPRCRDTVSYVKWTFMRSTDILHLR